MKLYVDDIRREPSTDSWILARTINEAIKAIIMFEPDEISLDHDISHEVMQESGYRLTHSCDECFCAVARYIVLFYAERNQVSLKPKITIHSANPVGAEENKEIFPWEVTINQLPKAIRE